MIGLARDVLAALGAFWLVRLVVRGVDRFLYWRRRSFSPVPARYHHWESE